MFKTETHAHTMPVSRCSRITPEEMVRLYKEAGYTTLFISDHFSAYHFNDDVSWEMNVDLLYGAYEKARIEGDRLGMNVLFSPELACGGNHYLMYNVTPAFLKARPDFFSLSIADVAAYARTHGVSLVQAHPYRDGKCYPTVSFVQGIEAINTNPRHENFDDRCMTLARESGLPMTGGSDTHRPEDVALCAVLSETPITTADEYLALLAEGAIHIERHGVVIL